jgi:hypothetical protein
MLRFVPVARLLRIAALYHGLLGLLATFAPGAVFGFLGLDPPSYRLFYGLAAAGPLAAAIACEVAVRRPDLRPGLAFGLMLGNLVGTAVIIVWLVWDDMPTVLWGTAVAAGLWAWLFWGVYAPEAAAPEPQPLGGPPS